MTPSVVPGLASVGAAVFGCISTGLAGLCTAIMALPGRRSAAFVAGIAVGVLAILFGLFASLVFGLDDELDAGARRLRPWATRDPTGVAAG